MSKTRAIERNIGLSNSLNVDVNLRKHLKYGRTNLGFSYKAVYTGILMIFKKHELKILDIHLGDAFSKTDKTDIIENSTLVDLSFSGCGYFLTIRNDCLPIERSVFNKPIVNGMAGNIESSFIIFIENRELMIECFSFGVSVPDEYRDWDIAITDSQ